MRRAKLAAAVPALTRYDFVCFYRDESHKSIHGASRYHGSSFPGCKDAPPLVIDAPSFCFHFFSDGSNTEWYVCVLRYSGVLFMDCRVARVHMTLGPVWACVTTVYVGGSSA